MPAWAITFAQVAISAWISRPNSAGVPGAVVDHEGLAQLLRQLLRDHARHQVDAAAGRGCGDDAHGLRRPALGGRR